MPPMGGGWDSFWWVELDFVSLMGSVTSIVAFWGVCELIKALGDLSINGREVSLSELKGLALISRN